MFCQFGNIGSCGRFSIIPITHCFEKTALWAGKLANESSEILQVQKRCFHFTSHLQGRFHESHPKGLHRDLEAEEREWKRQKENLFGVKDGLKDLRMEIVKWKDEWKTRLTDESEIVVLQGDSKVVWRFDSPEIFKTWMAGSDSDHNEGYSRCSLSLSPTGKGLFQGYINTELPKVGKMKKAGYCGIKCKRIMRSFNREWYLDWQQYTHLIMRVRGDGRTYVINLSTAGYFDLNWNDAYHYLLYTRGGPYWQNVKIPFSKFMLGSKGQLQDRQGRIPLDRIAAMGIAVGKVDGPFNLEIDYIGVECDRHGEGDEEFAYETYKVPGFIAGA